LRELVGDNEAKALEEIANVASPSEADAKSCLKTAFSSLMRSSKSDVADKSRALLELAKQGSISPGPTVNTYEELCELVERCNGQFPEDIGLFVLFFLNFVKLQPGQAMYLKADDIHAYISGDIIE